MRDQSVRNPDGKPTIRQVYAIARLLAVPACALSARHAITTHDAHYLALAEAEDAILVTADRRLAAAASRSVLLA
jgi:predicted nucleic acid-binding protein